MSSLFSVDSLLGLELDLVLEGDPSITNDTWRELRRFSPVMSEPRVPTDIGWNRHQCDAAEAKRREADDRRRRRDEREARRKLDEKRAKKRARELDNERKTQEEWDRKFVNVPTIRVEIVNQGMATPDRSWTLLSLLWLDIGWCMLKIGDRTAANLNDLIRRGAVTIFAARSWRTCRGCHALKDTTIDCGGSHSCIPCWLRYLTSFSVIPPPPPPPHALCWIAGDLDFHRKKK